MREANRSDLLELLRMGREFAEAYGTPMDRESTVTIFESLMDGDDSALFIADGGMIGGVLYPLYFNAGVTIAQELFWWVDPDKRKNGVGDELLTAFEDWAESKGADRVVMVALQNQAPRRVGQIYKGRGYKPHEHAYSKVI